MVAVIEKPVVLIVGIGSGIGRELADRYSADGYCVAGTYRSKPDSAAAAPYWTSSFQCNIDNPEDIKNCARWFTDEIRNPWQILVFSVGTMEPIGRFFELDFDSWEKSVVTNALSQLRFLHAFYPLRAPSSLNHVVFFTGAGTNGVAPAYSAYCSSKILLFKMCELLDNETPDLNVFIIGPGWVRTKIHEQTLKSAEKAESNLVRTVNFLNSERGETPYQDIYDCISWGVSQGRAVCGGRNLSVVNDRWRNDGEVLSEQLRRDINKYKLRRAGNE